MGHADYLLCLGLLAIALCCTILAMEYNTAATPLQHGKGDQMIVKKIGKYLVEFDRVERRYSVICGGLVISTHPTVDDAVSAVMRYIAGDKRRAR